ncbi:protein BNIP5 isoform X2 [Macrotis lagotis]|uniref:protein BNIP5 isoform X2 n=1 Tax=Macrotis lagotis TaxID=92651 RepID=UPI003D680F2C
MEKHRPSWKAEHWIRRKVQSPDKFQVSKKMPGSGNSQGSHLPRRSLSEQARPLEKSAKALDNDDSITLKLEKIKGTTREQGGQRSNHKDKVHKKGQHGLLKTLMNFFTRTGSEEQKDKGEKRSKVKCNSPEDLGVLEESVDSLESSSRKRDKEKGDKKSKEKPIFPQGSEPLETVAEPPETNFRKKDKEKGDKKSKEKPIFPQDPEPLGTLTEPPEVTSKKKDNVRKKSKEKGHFLQDPKNLEASVDPPELSTRKKDKKSGLKKAFSFKKHGNEEAKKSSGLDSRSFEARRPKRPNFLPLCISHRPASLTTPDEDNVHETMFAEVKIPDSTGLSIQVGQPPPKKEPSPNDIIERIVALLRDQGDRYNKQFKEDPSFMEALKNDSIQTLADALKNQEENLQEPEESQEERLYNLTIRFPGIINRIMGQGDHVIAHTFGHIFYNNEQHGTSSPFLSPD